ncbi:YdeI/OmpD-associated family protein [Saccharopolyspora shandongensis]|uniref:YdeI/OmpD-associated family protein n=1 Tax=Saccharopolyspora shandongensis TaxID=418495 RepID=UPI00342C0E86
MRRKEFSARLETSERGHVRVRMPFDPTEEWGKRQRHYVRGTINGTEFEGSLGSSGGEFFFPVSKKLREAAGVEPGDEVAVAFEPADPEPVRPPAELADALRGEPDAATFFGGLSGFYQRQYAGWIAGAKSADTRASRAAAVVALLKQGRKQR